MDRANTLVTIFGGSGFLGTQIVQRLARKHGVASPTIDTMIALVKGLQSTYLQQA